MTQDLNNSTLCPYWSGISQRCAMHSDGLFIPLENYVENFCTTSRHTGCMHLQPSCCPHSEEDVAAKIRFLQEVIVGIKH